MVVVVVMSLVSMVSMVFFYVHCSVSSTMMSIMMESIMNTMNAAVVPPNMTPMMTSMMVVVSSIMLSSTIVSCLLMYTLVTSVLCFCQGRKDNEQDKQGHQSMWLEGDCLSRTGFCDKRVEYLSDTLVVGGSQKLAKGNLWTSVGKKS